jgi:CRP-like cAMP-binding protein
MRGTHDPKVQLLADSPLFAGVREAGLRKAAALMDLQTFKTDELVMLEDYHGEQFLIIVEGTAEVRRDGELVATLGPGSFFGEAGLLGQRDRNATVRSTAKLRALTVESRGFQELRALLPEVAARIDAEAARRLPELSSET